MSVKGSSLSETTFVAFYTISIKKSNVEVPADTDSGRAETLCYFRLIAASELQWCTVYAERKRSALFESLSSGAQFCKFRMRVMIKNCFCSRVVSLHF